MDVEGDTSILTDMPSHGWNFTRGNQNSNAVGVTTPMDSYMTIGWHASLIVHHRHVQEAKCNQLWLSVSESSQASRDVLCQWLPWRSGLVVGSNSAPRWDALSIIKGRFLLRKWSCSDPCVLESIPTDLRDSQATFVLSHSNQYTKTRGRMECLMWPLPCECYWTPTHWMHDQEVTCFWCRNNISYLRVVFTHHSEGQDPSTSTLAWTDWLEWLCLKCYPKEWSKWRLELPLLSTHYIAQCFSDDGTASSWMYHTRSGIWTRWTGFCRSVVFQVGLRT